MRLVSNEVKLDFDDVLIVPQRSSIDTRKDVQITKDFRFKHTNITTNGFGIIASNLDTVGTFAMAKTLASLGCFTALHKFYKAEELIEFFANNIGIWDKVFYTIGTNENDLDKLNAVKSGLTDKIGENLFPQMLCIDVANGYTQSFSNFIQHRRDRWPNTVIMAGNVCTPAMTEELIMSGASIVKCGISQGYFCRTRKVTGVGYPQLSAVDECSYVAHGLGAHICSDGGHRYPSDVVKSFAVGSDMVMLGSMISGTDECEGTWTYHTIDYTQSVPTVVIDKKLKKSLLAYGMSSAEAMNKHYGGMANYRASEGASQEVAYKGPANKIIEEIAGGIRSACTYVGATKIKDLPKCASFVRVNKIHQAF